MDNWSLLVCQERWVLAGIVRPHPTNALKIMIDHCFVIRIWGTSRGLGELALDGPTEAGKYDYEGSGIEQNDDFVMRIIPCEPRASKKWTQLADLSTPTGKKR